MHCCKFLGSEFLVGSFCLNGFRERERRELPFMFKLLLTFLPFCGGACNQDLEMARGPSSMAVITSSLAHLSLKTKQWFTFTPVQHCTRATGSNVLNAYHNMCGHNGPRRLRRRRRSGRSAFSSPLWPLTSTRARKCQEAMIFLHSGCAIGVSKTSFWEGRQVSCPFSRRRQ